MEKTLIYPILAMVLLTLLVWLVMYYMRFKSVLTEEVNIEQLKEGEEQVIPTSFLASTRNFANLFEMPTLFYTLALLLIYSQEVDSLYLYLAWIYVGLRYLHSAIHITYNKIMHRFVVYFISSLLLWAMWVRFFLQMLE